MMRPPQSATRYDAAMRDRLDRSDLILLAVALACGVFFFASLDRLWPLADIDLNAKPERLISDARAFLTTQGVDVRNHSAATRLVVDENLLDYLVRAFGRDGTQAMIRGGRPIYLYEVLFKRADDPDAVWAMVHPSKGIAGWGRSIQEDAPGATVESDVARRTAADAIARSLGVRLGDFQEAGELQRMRPARRDHVFVYESFVSRTPELRERLTVTVAGDELAGIRRELVVPESARRSSRRREAPSVALQMTGFLLVGGAALAALVVFLTRLQRGQVRLARAAGWVVIIAVFFLVTQILRPADLLLRWDPLWPRAIATLETLALSLAGGAWIAFALFIVIAAGDALDRESGARRGDSMWLASRGRLLERSVGLASFRGFLVGLICGAALVAMVMFLEVVAGAKVAIQPQGFFFFALNSSLPALSTLLYFLMVAMVEEIGYRFFAGTWLLALTRYRWIAIVVPAILYGTTHTGLDFIPPYEPFWGRALAFSVVGAIWGWAYFRYDALTVVLSHFTADLFIFNWPRLGSGDPVLMVKAAMTVAVPLVPAVLLVVRRKAREA